MVVQVPVGLHRKQLNALDEYVDENDYANRSQLFREMVGEVVGVDADGNAKWASPGYGGGR